MIFFFLSKKNTSSIAAGISGVGVQHERHDVGFIVLNAKRIALTPGRAPERRPECDGRAIGEAKSFDEHAILGKWRGGWVAVESQQPTNDDALGRVKIIERIIGDDLDTQRLLAEGARE